MDNIVKLTIITPFFLFWYPKILIIYAVGVFANITVNHSLRGLVKQFSPLREKGTYVRKILEKYGKTLPYTDYEFPSENIQNLSYVMGFTATYFYDNFDYGKAWVMIFIVIFNLITIVTAIILYKRKQNSIIQLFAGEIIGLSIGIFFYSMFFGNNKIQNNLL